MNDKLHRVIGIDLGTTYSAVAAYDTFNEQAVILKNAEDNGAPTTPSVVGLVAQNRVIVGRKAKEILKVEPHKVVIEVKREMGELFRPETIEKYANRPDAASNRNLRVGEPVEVSLGGEWYRPQEISAFTLMKMKEIAEREMGGEICDAVITVPAYFTERQKKATEEAGLLAGLYPRQLIPEPTAAAICYGVDRMEATRKVYLVYDLGGGTFDVSIITVEGTNIIVIATSGDRRLGGGDFDDAITAWALQELRTKHNIDASDPRWKALIKLRAEETKISLSSFQTAHLSLPELRPSNPPILELSRECFESLIESYLSKSLNCVDEAIKFAGEKGIRREEIDAILLVGGSSKIPKVRSKLLDYFGKDESFVRSDLDPDAVVARGAAIVARRFQASTPPFNIKNRPSANLVNAEADDLHIPMITEHTLGVGIQDNLFSKIVERGKSIPISVTRQGYTNSDMATAVEVPVYQGEGQYTYDNTLIGTMRYEPIEPKPSGFHKFEITFSLDQNGLLSMTLFHVNKDERRAAEFKHKTSIGGLDAIPLKQADLRAKFGGLTAPPVPPTGVMANVVPGQPFTPPPPPAPGGIPGAGPYPGVPAPGMAPVAQAGGYPGAAVPAGAPPASGYPVPQQPAYPGQGQPMPPAGGYVPPPPGGNGMPPGAPAAGMPTQQIAVPMGSAAGGAPSSGPLQPARDIPEQFKSIVRRAQKEMLKQSLPQLEKVFNAFVAALNAGRPESELVELGDELEDCYIDCRR